MFYHRVIISNDISYVKSRNFVNNYVRTSQSAGGLYANFFANAIYRCTIIKTLFYYNETVMWDDEIDSTTLSIPIQAFENKP